MKGSDKPAILGGEPEFKEFLPIVRPTLPRFSAIRKDLENILKSGIITNATYVAKWEEQVKAYTGARNVTVVANCTSGLILALQYFKLKGEVLLPSFTFSATGHSIIWNNLRPRFVDCSPDKFTMDVEDLKERLTDKVCAIMGVHVFGNPCDADALMDIAQDRHIPLVFDAAHALGSIYKDRHVGCLGNAEVFSASPTKLIAAGEGGIVGTSDDALAKYIKVGRNYGDDGSGDPKFFGLNARESEFHALFGIYALKNIEKFVKRRNELVKAFKAQLGKVPGLSFQRIEDECRSTYKDLAILVDKETYGCDREAVIAALAKENIMTKRYFYPPLHRMTLMKDIAEGSFPNTDKVSQNIVCLPIHSHMTVQTIKKICHALDRVQRNAKEVQQAVRP